MRTIKKARKSLLVPSMCLAMLAVSAAACSDDDMQQTPSGDVSGGDTGMEPDAGDTGIAPDVSDDTGIVADVTPDTGMPDDTGVDDTGVPDTGVDIADTTDTGVSDTPDTGAVESASVNGVVDSTREKAVSGAFVTAMRVEADGELTALSEGTETTDGEGRYRLSVELSGESETDVIITAESAGESGSVMVSGLLEADGEVTAAPIDVETSAETDVYLEARGSGSWDDETHSRSMLRASISAELAADLQLVREDGEEGEYDAEVETTADAVVSGMTAWYLSLTHESGGSDEEDIDAALDAIADAQIELDAALDEATSTEEEEEAADAYAEAVLDAYAEVDVGLDQLVLAVQATAEASGTYAAELGEEAVDSAMADIAISEAFFVRAVVDAGFAALEADGEVSTEVFASIEAAGDALEASIEAAGEAGADAEADIEAAWEAYSAEIEAEIDAVIAAAGVATVTAYTTVEATIDTAASALVSALGALSASAAIELTAEATVEAFVTFYAAVTASASVDTLVVSGLAETVAEIVVEVRATLAASTSVGSSE